MSGENNTKLLGDEGEDLACEYLVKNGYKIIGRNYRINFGEIDIIAKKRGWFSDKTIHFVEVKTSRGSEGFFPEERVDWKKQNRYRRLAEVWLLKNKIPENTPYQIDIIAISGEKVDFFENAVSA